MRKKLTIPGAGETKNFDVTGRSFAIEKISKYSEPSQVPIIRTTPGNQDYPAYNRNSYNAGEFFTDLIIEGTEESAGDEIQIWVSDQCITETFNIILSESYSTLPGNTIQKTVGDSPGSLTELELQDSEGNLPSKIYVAVSPETGAENGIKYSFGSNPVQGEETAGMKLNSSMGSIEITDMSWILAFKWIAQTSGETPVINITPEY